MFSSIRTSLVRTPLNTGLNASLQASTIPLFASIQTRGFKVQRKKKGKAFKTRGKKVDPDKKVPLFSATLKRFYVKIHPDLLHAHPEAKEQNEASLQDLMGFITEIQNKEEKYPAAGVKRLVFYVKTNKPGITFRRVLLPLQTTGGKCQKLVGKTFSSLFENVGLEPEFTWVPNHICIHTYIIVIILLYHSAS